MQVTPAILYEDNHLIAINKPFGMLSQGDQTGDACAVTWVREYIRETYAKPGNVYVGLLHRLDRPVAGVLLLAKTSKAAGRMTTAFKDRKVQKVYQAVVLRSPSPPTARLEGYLAQLPGKNIVRVYDRPGDGRKKATLDYRTLDRKQGHTLLEIRLLTGRKHQIRAQMAAVGCPLLGDLKYGAPAPLPDQSVALFAKRLSFIHPTRKEEIVIEAPYPETDLWQHWKAH